MRASKAFPAVLHQADVCVVGGGMAGICAAVGAARHGARVVLMHDRPVVGGNASSECRVHISGADRTNSIPNMRETGVLEEVRLENVARNPPSSWAEWDIVLYGKVAAEPNITTLLNCSCLDATMEGERIASVTGWQLTSQTAHTVSAAVFVDCSGDGVLAPLTGAQFRMGREARAEYGESIAPEVADARTMGMTICFQAREYDSPQPFIPAPWANRYEDDSDVPYGAGAHQGWYRMGYWWVELGGEQDSIRDTEAIRDELLRTSLGLWDHIKNRGDHGAENWALEWLQFMPAKRESRRYIGDHVLTQGDVEAEGKFADLVAYGGWSMDDHHPAGFRSGRLGKEQGRVIPPTIFHHAPSPYGIPYRALYSRNTANLMFAGRCASATHAAMSSTRVMGTACSMGQAAGVAAALAARAGVTPREIGPRVDDLQQALLADDCYLPWVRQRFPELTSAARLEASQGDPEPLRDGASRPVGNDAHSWRCRPGDSVSYLFPTPRKVEQACLVLDSALTRNLQMTYFGDYGALTAVPDVMARDFRIEGLTQGRWEPVAHIEANFMRLVRVPIGRELAGVRFVLEATWGSAETQLFSFYVT